eukprot:2540313-Lingulodinium_polyedra.AAC.1
MIPVLVLLVIPLHYSGNTGGVGSTCGTFNSDATRAGDAMDATHATTIADAVSKHANSHIPHHAPA